MKSHPGVAADQQSFRIEEFCQRNAISKSFFYKIKAQGRGPRLTDLNRITKQAEADWLAERERAAMSASGSEAAA